MAPAIQNLLATLFLRNSDSGTSPRFCGVASGFFFALWLSAFCLALPKIWHKTFLCTAEYMSRAPSYLNHPLLDAPPFLHRARQMRYVVALQIRCDDLTLRNDVPAVDTRKARSRKAILLRKDNDEYWRKENVHESFDEGLFGHSNKQPLPSLSLPPPPRISWVSSMSH